MIDPILRSYFDQEAAKLSAQKHVANPPNGKGKVALCISGGGYRAALFHLGVIRCLHEMGLLQTVDLLSSVSGGSILSAFLARRMYELGIDKPSFNDFETEISEPFRDIATYDIRTVPAIKNVLWNWKFPNLQCRDLQNYYKRRVTTAITDDGNHELLLRDLPSGIKQVFCTTDVTFGVNWEFRKYASGSYRAGYINSGGIPLSLAVMASSCFPPVFGPFTFDLQSVKVRFGKYKKSEVDDLRRRIAMSDGGVYDNFGLEPVKSNYSTVIVSDGGFPFPVYSGKGLFSSLSRIVGISLNQNAALRKRALFASFKANDRNGIFVQIGRSRKSTRPVAFDGYLNPKTRFLIATIRTDLDRFSEAETKILENHGYFETYRRITHQMTLPKPTRPLVLPKAQFSPVIPHRSWENEDKVISALRNSSSRFSLSRLLEFGM